MNASSRAYHPLSVLIHWSVVGLVLVCFASIQVATRLSGADPLRSVLMVTHVISGQLLFLLNLIRLAIFSSFGTPVADGLDFHQAHALRCLHALIYGTIGFLACSGSLLALAYAAGQTVFGIEIPLVLTPLALSSLRELHGFVSVFFILLCLIHALASLGMHLFSGCGTLAKMRIHGKAGDYITSPKTESYLKLDTQPVESSSPR